MVSAGVEPRLVPPAGLANMEMSTILSVCLEVVLPVRRDVLLQAIRRV